MPIRQTERTVRRWTGAFSSTPTWAPDTVVLDRIEWTKVKPPRQSYCTASKTSWQIAPGFSVKADCKYFNGTSLIDHGCTGTGIRYSGFLNSSDVALADPSAGINSARLGAIDAVLNPTSKPLVDIPLFLFEFKDFARTFVGVQKTLKNIWMKLSDTNSCLKTLGWLSPGDSHVLTFKKLDGRKKSYTRASALAELQSMPQWTLLEISNSVLLTQLGILPTVSDCKGLYALYNKVQGGFKNLRRVIRKGSVVRASYLYSNQLKIPPTTGAWTAGSTDANPRNWQNYLYTGSATGVFTPATYHSYWTRERGVVSGRLADDVEISSYDELKALTGFTQGPLTFAWEVTRLSWLVDYFIGIGSFLSTLERHQVAVNRKLKFDGGVWLSKAVETGIDISTGSNEFEAYVDPRYTNPKLIRWRRHTVYSNWWTIERSTAFTRRPLTAADSLMSVSLKTKRLSLIRLGTVAALVVRLWAPRGGK